MSPRIVPIPEGEALAPDFSSFVDVTVLNSVLAAFVIILAAIWTLYAFNRLWQSSLARDAAGAIAAAEGLGLTLRPAGYGPRLVAEGRCGAAGAAGRPVRVEWRGGVFGARTVLFLDGTRVASPGWLTTARDLEAALAGDAPSAPAA